MFKSGTELFSVTFQIQYSRHAASSSLPTLMKEANKVSANSLQGVKTLCSDVWHEYRENYLHLCCCLQKFDTKVDGRWTEAAFHVLSEGLHIVPGTCHLHKVSTKFTASPTDGSNNISNMGHSVCFSQAKRIYMILVKSSVLSGIWGYHSSFVDDVTLCHWASVSRCLRGAYWLHLQWFWGP